MNKIKREMLTDQTHQDCNSFGLILLCQKIYQGYILDRYKKRAFTLGQLANGLSDIKTLRQKPKFIIIQDSREGNLFPLEVSFELQKSKLYIL